MAEKINCKSAFQRAYSAWFSAYEQERRHQKKRKGAPLIGFPEPPASPENIAHLLDQIGVKNALGTLGVHRSTIARWLTGKSVIPRSSWLLLVLLAEGRLPGMSEDWRDFRFDGDTLCQVGTRNHYTAREIAGWPYQVEHSRALARRVVALEKEKAHLLKVGYFEAANDALMA
jgi:hypothetical protein